MKKEENPLARENAQLREKIGLLEDKIGLLTDKNAELEILSKNYRRIAYRLGDEVKNHWFHVLRIFIETIEARDHYTRGHSERVTKYVIIIGKAMDLSESEIKQSHQAGHLHDAGKIYWDREDFRRKELKPKHRQTLREHPVVGSEYLLNIGIDKKICKIVRHHHERYDGKSIITHPNELYTGYPGELSGEDIPLPSRIIAVADTFDAMTTDRPYRKKKSVEETIEELKRCSGLPYNKRLIPNRKSEMQFDPEIIKALLSVKTVGSEKSNTSHKLGCPYLLRIDSLDMVVNPSGYAPCKACIRKAV